MTEIEFALEALDAEQTKSGTSGQVLRTALGKNNRVSFAPPRLGLFDTTAFAMAADELAKNKMKGRKVVTVESAVTFHPDFGCAFLAADFSISFSSSGGGKVVVIDIVPHQIERDETYKTVRENNVKIEGSISPGLTKILTEFGRSNTVEVGGQRKLRDVWAFGLGGEEAGWRFQASVGNALAGIFGGLRFAISMPENETLRGEFRFGAEIAIEGLLDSWATAAFGLFRKQPNFGTIFDIEGA